MIPALISFARGSSPLTRGKPPTPENPRPCDGLIPAHAGKTGFLRRASMRLGAHPRSRGENDCTDPNIPLMPGSSPLTRGKRLREQAQQARRRLIPAHAGKTLSVDCTDPNIPAHPRSRGENATHPDEVMSALGSSPLTRGKRVGAGASVCVVGLIPAHAGKTVGSGPSLCYQKAHPRSRGENLCGGVDNAGDSGSSPLTRGKQVTHYAVDGRAGLIPAHAGKTREALAYPSRSSAHPRSRGENMKCVRVIVCPFGSSPLTRGKP